MRILNYVNNLLLDFLVMLCQPQYFGQASVEPGSSLRGGQKPVISKNLLPVLIVRLVGSTMTRISPIC